MNKIIFASIVSLLFIGSYKGPVDASLDERDVKAFAYDSFKLVLTHSLDKNLSGNYSDEIADPSGLILLLADIDTNEARTLLLELTEVKIGSVHIEALDSALTKQGKKIYAGLKHMITKPVTCSFKKNNIKSDEVNKLQCLSRQDRDRYIQSILQYIDQGKKIQYAL